MIERIYHPYFNWEDFEFGMYEKTCYMDETQLMWECALLLKCPEWLWESMQYWSEPGLGCATGIGTGNVELDWRTGGRWIRWRRSVRFR